MIEPTHSPAESESASLAAEARYFGKRVLDLDLAPEIVDRYVAANKALFARADLADSLPLVKALRAVVATGMDVEALEFALRLRRRRNLVTQKLHILSYLLETHAAYLSLYLNDHRYRLGAYMTLAAHVPRAIWKYLRGRRLLRRLGILGA
jgi:hypothetical protein